MSYDSVRIDPDAAAAALQAWQASAAQLRQTVMQCSGAIEAAEGAQPWGGDSSGREFGTTYLEGAEPSRGAVSSLAGQFEEVGQQVETAVQASLASDGEQASSLASTQGTLDSL
ncbi:hypothetical protein SAMN03159343_0902 [Klenkia marina]|uniref:WXG100 family type VII secretion target n=1 Tax=Klenkia marina TaxID=1960309 RepID=A0A1G4XG06_9ACTN|nr:hypothetical protein [Klenkia marina]SCX40182.1 hypothetical protein SAMN03159343_0902 [Klenkia marina]